MTDLELLPEERLFREEFLDWLSEHLVGEFKAASGVGGPVDDEEWELRLAWERELAAGRWLNVSWPVEFGGRGGSATQELIVHIEHARAEAPYWVGVQGRDLFGPTLLEFGTPEQKARFLPPITRCEEFWGQGFSEPDAGSDLAGLTTHAHLAGNEWVITGQKVWTTFGDHADWLYVLCRTNPAAVKHRGISMLLVPRYQAGVVVRPIRNMAGGTEFCEVFFDEARTAADLVVGEIDGGWAVVMGTLGHERSGVGVLPFQASFEREMRSMIAEIRSRGLNRDPVLRQRIARTWSELRIMQLNNDRQRSTARSGGHPGAESSLGKLYWANWHRNFTELSVDLLGPAGLISGLDDHSAAIQRRFLNARAETIYGGANEIQRNIVAERVLGLPREPAPSPITSRRPR